MRNLEKIMASIAIIMSSQTVSEPSHELIETKVITNSQYTENVGPLSIPTNPNSESTSYSSNYDSPNYGEEKRPSQINICFYKAKNGVFKFFNMNNDGMDFNDFDCLRWKYENGHEFKFDIREIDNYEVNEALIKDEYSDNALLFTWTFRR